MTTFVVSLFLPYTIDFSVSTPRPPSPEPLPRHEPPVYENKSLSLFTGPTAPDTPDISDHDEFFLGLTPDSPALHFPKPQDPRTLARTEVHVPEWGRTHIFNQPRSRAGAAPPSTILRYQKTHEQFAHTARSKLNGTYTPRRGSQEKQFSENEWTVKPALQGNGGLTNAIRAACENGDIPQHKFWVGTLGFPTDALKESKQSEIGEVLENEYEALTVFVSDNDFDGHYSHYCKTILWPVFHYQIPDHPKSKAYEDHSWIYYVKINETFAEKVVESYKHGDTIWIHDYHLLLVPSMIRKKLPEARIGFFLHTAFPSSEVFRCLAVRKQLLEGMLGANLIAFQAQEYANHFLHTCSRLLLVEATETGVQLEHHFVDVVSVPIGIVPEQLMAARKEPDVKQWIDIILERYQGKTLIVGRDKLDNVRGVRQKLLSYELFLNKNPEWREKVVLIQVATSAGGENHDLENTVADIVTRINSQHSTLAHQPLVFLKQDIAFSQYIALLTAADVLMVTSLRDGMNLTCHEYLLCQDGGGGQKKFGPLILSEFTGSASVFQGKELSVNPWDYQQCARAIKYALEMSREERERRYKKILDILMHNSGTHWVRELASHLAKAHEGHKQRNIMSVPRLNMHLLQEHYKAATSRLFILDYEDTLAVWASPTTNVTASPQRVVDTLIELLGSSDKNVVYVMSSRTPAELEHVFHQIPSIGLIAENGCFVRPFNSDEWIDLIDSAKTCSWKDDVFNQLMYYYERIEGAWIEERNCSFIFHYEDCADGDMEAATRQAGECANQIVDSCQSQRVTAVPIDKAVIVEPMDFNKADAAKVVLKLLRTGKTTYEGFVKARDDDLIKSSREARQRKNDIGDAAADDQASAPVSERTIGEKHTGPLRAQKARLDAWLNAAHSSTKERSKVPDFLMVAGDDREDRAQKARLDAWLHAADSSTKESEVPDFLMVAGDDREDEAVFRWANGLAKDAEVKSVVSVCVGKRNTQAAYTLTQGVTGLITALQKLARLPGTS